MSRRTLITIVLYILTSSVSDAQDPTNPQKGIYFLLRETAYPEFLGTYDMTNWGTSFILSGYQPIWKGALITGDLYAQIELRQHLASRFGCVAWVGAGTVFPSLEGFAWKNILPNYGVGLRVEFKHNMNLRVDFGFGKETAGLCFGFGEAF